MLIGLPDNNREVFNQMVNAIVKNKLMEEG